MFERFTKAARAAVTDAVVEAQHRQDSYVGSEHLLLGLLKQPSDLVSQSIGLSLDDLRAGLDSLDREALGAVGISFDFRSVHETRSRRLKRPGHRPFTNGAKKVLTGALEQAIALGHRHLGVEHILLSITERPSHDLTIRLLEHLGLRPALVRSNLLTQLRRSA